LRDIAKTRAITFIEFDGYIEATWKSNGSGFRLLDMRAGKTKADQYEIFVDGRGEWVLNEGR
jgi:hypothetical protein